jgi:dihydrofolate synthase/folylpolyglutamate synthase
MDCRKDNTYSIEYQKFDIYKNNELYLKDLKYPLLGNYQKKNLATVICALDILKESFNINNTHIINGLNNVIKNTSLMGRWQVINRNPLAIADTGHNVAGINEVNRQLAETKYNKLHFVLSVVNDKDIDGILNLLPKDAEYYFCKADIPRGLSVNILAEKAIKCGLNGKIYDSVRHAYSTALENAKEGDLVFVGGSNFTVAEVV